MKTRLLSGVLCVYGKTIVPEGLAGLQLSFNFTVRKLIKGELIMKENIFVRIGKGLKAY